MDPAVMDRSLMFRRCSAGAKKMTQNNYQRSSAYRRVNRMI
jgi:hypothetical protein